MKMLKDVPLKLYSTMRLGGTADFMTEVKTKEDLVKANDWAESRGLPVRMIGSGSNIIWRDEGFKGLLIIDKISGFKKIDQDLATATYQIGAGENWDNVVEKLVSENLSGVEGLSFIPGTVGAAPVQNIGAYGQELASTLVELEAYDRMEKAFVVIDKQNCAFGYRTSRFKTIDSGRFLISSITLRLSKDYELGKIYADIEKYFAENNITDITPANYRKAVIAVRKKKLPDPAKVANTGSFFGNPIIRSADFKKIAKKQPAILKKPKGWPQAPYWELPGGMVKISAAWLIQQAGFTDKLDTATGMALWPNQSLVLINKRARSTQDLLDFEQKITYAVLQKFGIQLEREPEILP